MKKHLINFLILIVLSTPAFCQNDTGPWKSLFNGKDFTNWKMVGSKGVAVVVDSAFTCHMTANTTEHTFVCTEDKFSDFILELDVKTDSNYNTGILLRCIKIHALNDRPESEKMLGRFKNIRVITENPEQYLRPMDLQPKVAN